MWLSLFGPSRDEVLRRLSVAFGAKRTWLDLLLARTRSRMTHFGHNTGMQGG